MASVPVEIRTQHLQIKVEGTGQHAVRVTLVVTGGRLGGTPGTEK
jgi:hypothetical protein